MEVVSRKEAIDRGLLHFFTGQPCLYGHLSKRYASTNGCLECEKARQKRRKYIEKIIDGKAVSMTYKEYQRHRYHHEGGRKQRSAYCKRPDVQARIWAQRGLPEPTRPRPENCECCGSAPGIRGLSLDHCHVTGGFRGWLCNKCNVSIGGLGDNLDGLHRAVEYLMRTRSVN